MLLLLILKLLSCPFLVVQYHAYKVIDPLQLFHGPIELLTAGDSCSSLPLTFESAGHLKRKIAVSIFVLLSKYQ